MKQEVPPTLVIGIVVILVAIVGLLGFRMFRTSSPQSDHAAFMNHQRLKDAREEK